MTDAESPKAEQTATRPLRLVVMDADDLAVISAHLQDAVLRPVDMMHLPRQQRFVLAAERFDWECADCGPFQRCATGLHFERVRRVASLNVPRNAPDTVLNLLSITFEPGEAPSGQVLLTFAGGAAVRLDVECLEASCSDLGPRRNVDARPGHALDETPETT